MQKENEEAIGIQTLTVQNWKKCAWLHFHNHNNNYWI